MKYHAMNDKVIIEHVANEKMSNIIEMLPESTTVRYRIGRVLSVGPGVAIQKTGKRIPLKGVQEGDLIIYDMIRGTVIKDGIKVLDHHEVLGIVEGY